MNTKIKRLTAINYFGGKSRHLDWILPHIPPHREYLEPFFGSGAIFLNKEPALIECVSDKEGRLINFFTVLRDRPGELINKLNLTLYARGEFQIAAETDPDPVEDARRFFIRAVQSFGGITHNIRRMNSYRIDVQESRHGKAACVSKFLTKIKNLSEVAERLRNTQIDNRDALYPIPKFNLSSTFIYLDPPYTHASRTSSNDYFHEMTTEDHRTLAALNCESKAMIMISHYDDLFYDNLYPAPQWMKILGPIRKSNISKSIINREALYINYHKKEVYVNRTMAQYESYASSL